MRPTVAVGPHVWKKKKRYGSARRRSSPNPRAHDRLPPPLLSPAVSRRGGALTAPPPATTTLDALSAARRSQVRLRLIDLVAETPSSLSPSVSLASRHGLPCKRIDQSVLGLARAQDCKCTRTIDRSIDRVVHVRLQRTWPSPPQHSRYIHIMISELFIGSQKCSLNIGCPPSPFAAQKMCSKLRHCPHVMIIFAVMLRDF